MCFVKCIHASYVQKKNRDGRLPPTGNENLFWTENLQLKNTDFRIFRPRQTEFGVKNWNYVSYLLHGACDL
jgi:hypothetical protein